MFIFQCEWMLMSSTQATFMYQTKSLFWCGCCSSAFVFKIELCAVIKTIQTTTIFRTKYINITDIFSDEFTVKIFFFFSNWLKTRVTHLYTHTVLSYTLFLAESHVIKMNKNRPFKLMFWDKRHCFQMKFRNINKSKIYSSINKDRSWMHLYMHVFVFDITSKSAEKLAECSVFSVKPDFQLSEKHLKTVHELHLALSGWSHKQWE